MISGGVVSRPRLWPRDPVAALRHMYQPAHIDGRTVVILRREGHRYTIVESGRLQFDGEDLSLTDGESTRLFSNAECNLLMLVVSDNRIPECRCFDFFLMQ